MSTIYKIMEDQAIFGYTDLENLITGQPLRELDQLKHRLAMLSIANSGLGNDNENRLCFIESLDGNRITSIVLSKPEKGAYQTALLPAFETSVQGDEFRRLRLQAERRQHTVYLVKDPEADPVRRVAVISVNRVDALLIKESEVEGVLEGNLQMADHFRQAGWKVVPLNLSANFAATFLAYRHDRETETESRT